MALNLEHRAVLKPILLSTTTPGAHTGAHILISSTNTIEHRCSNHGAQRYPEHLSTPRGSLKEPSRCSRCARPQISVGHQHVSARTAC